MKFRSQHVIYKPLSFFWSSTPFAQFLKTTSSSHLLLILKLTWGWGGPVRLRTGFPLRMFLFSIGLLSSSAFVLVPSWPALLFFLFKFFPGLQEELQCHHRHSPFQKSSSSSPVRGWSTSSLATGIWSSGASLTLKRRLYVLWLADLYF